jgi:hypothetical protein
MMLQFGGDQGGGGDHTPGGAIMILRAILFLALLIPAGIVRPARAADLEFPVGSPIGIVPPAGFVASKHFPGFENADNESIIMLLALPTQAFAEIEATMTAEAVKAQGIAEDKREVLTLPSGRGQMVAGMAEENGQKVRKWMFVGLVPGGVALAAVRVADAARQTYSDDAIRTALLSIGTRPTVPIEEQLSLMPFKLNELSGLRVVRVLGGRGVFLTEGDKDSPDPSEQPVFVASIGQGGPEQTSERANFARNMFTGMPEFKDIRILSGDMLRLGGGSTPTHELQAEAKDAKTNVPMRIVQWVRFGQGVFIRMIGVARADDWLKSFTRFRAVRDGIGPREE